MEIWDKDHIHVPIVWQSGTLNLLLPPLARNRQAAAATAAANGK